MGYSNTYKKSLVDWVGNYENMLKQYAFNPTSPSFISNTLDTINQMPISNNSQSWLSKFGNFLGAGAGFLGSAIVNGSNLGQMDTSAYRMNIDELKRKLADWENKDYNANTDIYTRYALSRIDANTNQAIDQSKRDITRRGLGDVQGLASAIQRIAGYNKHNATTSAIAQGDQLFERQKAGYLQMYNQLLSQAEQRRMQAEMYNAQMQEQKKNSWMNMLQMAGMVLPALL